MAFRPHRFYPVTDERGPASHRDQVVEVVRAGARLVQIRDKRLPDRDLLEELDAAVTSCRRARALLVVNDRVDLALLSGAGGVHVGEEDLPVADARRILGPAAVVGASSHDPASAAAAEAQGADYVAIGPVYATGTKPDAGTAVGLAAVRAVRAAVRIPVVAIGGITLERSAEVLDAGADSVAVIGDLSRHPTPGPRAASFAARLDGEARGRGLVFLTGFMGSGKTSVGGRLSERLGCRFVDLDGWIEETEGRTIAEIFASRGEAAFRDLEIAALGRIPVGADCVVALGGGTLLSSAARARVRELGALVWLDMDLDRALRRCAAGRLRPLLQRGADPSILHAARLPGYRGADAVVAAGEGDVDAVAAAVERCIGPPAHGI